MIAADRTKIHIFYIILLSMAVLVTHFLTQLSTSTALQITAGCLILVISILKTEAALYILIFSMLLSPEIKVAGGGGRDVVLRVDDLLLVIIGLSWLAKTAIFKEMGIFRKTPLNRPILIYAMVCAFSTIFGVLFGRVKPAAGFFYVLKYVEYFLVYFLIVNHLRNEDQIRRFIWAILLTGVLLSVYGMLQIPSGVRVSAPFEGKNGEPNTMGGYLLLLISLVSGLFLTARTQKEKLVFLGLAAFFSVPFIYTLSRTSWFALIPMIGTLIYFSYRKTVLIYFVILAIALTPMVAPKSAKERFLYTFQKTQTKSIKVAGVALDPSSSDRITSWGRCLNDFVNHPILGYGITGYGFIDGQYFRTLVELGLVGMIALLYLMVVIFREVLRVYRACAQPYYKGLALGMLAGCSAMFMHSVGANTFIIVRIMEPFWFLVGVVVMMPSLEQDNPENEQGRPGQLRKSGVRK
ncbi:MAG: O-antigen ligase family protein [bacterium]